MEDVYDALEEDWDDEDEATQYMIEQSLLCSGETPRYESNLSMLTVQLTNYTEQYSAVVFRSDPALENIDHEEIFTAIQAGKG